MKNLLFYYPQHFNRSEEGTNPFFDKLLEICDRNNICYDLMEEPDRETNKPRNSSAKKGDIFFWTVTVIRKILSKTFSSKDFYVREKVTARLLNLITFGHYKYRRYITISGSMYHLFANLNPRAKVYDLQHGILYKQHPTFFKDRHLRPQFFKANLHFLFWGNGYERTFVKGDEEILAGRTHIVGYPIPTAQQVNLQNEDHTIIVSLQFTHDIDEDGLKQDKQILADFLASTESSGYKVLLKHHPRFNNAIYIDDLLSRYTHAELTNQPLDELVSKVRLHVTYFSTTAFEYAQQGIPTYFLPSQGRELYELFYTEYNYPLYQGMEIGAVLTRLEDKEAYAADSATVYDWYERFYSPLDEKLFLELIR